MVGDRKDRKEEKGKKKGMNVMEREGKCEEK